MASDFMAFFIVFQARNDVKLTISTLAWNPPMEMLVSAFEMCNGLFDQHQV